MKNTNKNTLILQPSATLPRAAGRRAFRGGKDPAPLGRGAKLPAVRTGRKILVSWQNLMDYLTVSA